MSMHAEPLQVFVGTYTGPKSDGIYAFTFDPDTGKATPRSRGAVGESIVSCGASVGALPHAANETGSGRASTGGMSPRSQSSPRIPGYRELKPAVLGRRGAVFRFCGCHGKESPGRQLRRRKRGLSADSSGRDASVGAPLTSLGAPWNPQRQKEPHAPPFYPIAGQPILPPPQTSDWTKSWFTDLIRHRGVDAEHTSLCPGRSEEQPPAPRVRPRRTTLVCHQ